MLNKNINKQLSKLSSRTYKISNVSKVYQNKPVDLPLLQDTRGIPSFLNGVRPSNLEDIEVPVSMEPGMTLYENRTIRDKWMLTIASYVAFSGYNYLLLPELVKKANIFMTDNFTESVSTRIEYANQYDIIGPLTNNGIEGVLVLAIGCGLVLGQRVLNSIPVKMQYSEDKDVLYIYTYDVMKDTLSKSAHMTEHMQFIPTYATGYHIKESSILKIYDTITTEEFHIWTHDKYWNSELKADFMEGARYYFDKKYDPRSE